MGLVGSVCVGSTVIEVDPIITDAERVEAIALGGETLLSLGGRSTSTCVTGS
jgi:hypothetical protein